MSGRFISMQFCCYNCDKVCTLTQDTFAVIAGGISRPVCSPHCQEESDYEQSVIEEWLPGFHVPSTVKKRG